MMNKKLIRDLSILSILPLIYVANSLEKGILLGAILLIVSMALKGVSILSDKFLERRISTYVKLMLGAALILVIQVVLSAYFTLNQLISLYLSLILFNVNIMYKEEETLNVIEHLISNVGALVLIILIAFFREFLGTGAITFKTIANFSTVIFESKYAISFLTSASGGFILAGFTFGVLNAMPLERE